MIESDRLNVDDCYIEKIEYNHIYNNIMKMFNIIRPKFKYSADNMQTMSVTIHPLFTILLCSLTLAGTGSVNYENACDEMFGTDEFKEGPHAFLCHKHFAQLGPYKVEHYNRCSDMVNQVHSFISKDKINVIYSFLICCELANFIFEDLEHSMRSLGVKDDTYIIVHKRADNLKDGHGVRMLQELERNSTMNINDFNRGMKLFSDLFLDIFDYE